MKSGKKSIFPKIILLFMLLPLGIPFLIPEIGLAYSGVTYQLIETFA